MLRVADKIDFVFVLVSVIQPGCREEMEDGKGWYRDVRVVRPHSHPTTDEHLAADSSFASHWRFPFHY